MADPASGLPRLTVLAGDLSGKELLLEEVVDNILIGVGSGAIGTLFQEFLLKHLTHGVPPTTPTPPSVSPPPVFPPGLPKN